jgi:cyanophycinase
MRRMRGARWPVLGTSALLAFFCFSAARANLAVFRAGSDLDAHPKLHGPVLDLAGSSAEEHGLQAMVDAVRGCSDCDAKLDVVIIRASGAEGLNTTFRSLHGVNSATTFVITDRPSAEHADVLSALRKAEVVWFAGGDQCNYIRWIKGTRAQREVERVYRRGGGVGGNSAGLAIQGEVAYDACPDVSAASADVLANPFHRDVSLSSNFFHWRPLRGIVTDTHFTQRKRLGRLLVFLARTYAERRRPITGLGVDENTSVIVTADQKGRVYGPGAAYLIALDHPAETLAPGKPLTARRYRVWKFDSGSEIDFAHRPTTGGYSIDVIDGTIIERWPQR